MCTFGSIALFQNSLCLNCCRPHILLKPGGMKEQATEDGLGLVAIHYGKF